MAPDELRALAEAIVYRDSLAIARAADYLRACADAEPVARIYTDGWQLVPVKPTREMLESTSWPGCAATDYEHMLATAPQAEPTEAQIVAVAEVLLAWEAEISNRVSARVLAEDVIRAALAARETK